MTEKAFRKTLTLRFKAWFNDQDVRFSLAPRLMTDDTNRQMRPVFYYAGVLGMPYTAPDAFGNRKGYLYAANDSNGRVVTHDEDGLLNLDGEFVEIQLATGRSYAVHAPMLFAGSLLCTDDGATQHLKGCRREGDRVMVTDLSIKLCRFNSSVAISPAREEYIGLGVEPRAPKTATAVHLRIHEMCRYSAPSAATDGKVSMQIRPLGSPSGGSSSPAIWREISETEINTSEEIELNNNFLVEIPVRFNDEGMCFITRVETIPFTSGNEAEFSVHVAGYTEPRHMLR